MVVLTVLNSVTDFSVTLNEIKEFLTQIFRSSDCEFVWKEWHSYPTDTDTYSQRSEIVFLSNLSPMFVQCWYNAIFSKCQNCVCFLESHCSKL